MNNIKKRLLSMLLTVAMLCGLCVPTAFAAESRYSDTRGHWAEKSIDRWSGYDIIGGYGGGLFGPNDTITRAQMAAILARLLALPEAKNAGFTDVAEDAWYADGINRCYAAGIMLGNEGKALPNAPISREQTIVMLCRALGIEPKADADLSAYTDADKVSSYAVGYIAAMVENGMVSGTSKTTLSPASSITRGAVVTILDRGIAVYANEDNATVDAKDADGLILIVADKVTVKNAPKGASVLVSKSAVGTKVNGKTVAAGTTYTATEQPKPSSGGGYTPTPGPSDLTVSAANETVPSGTYRNVTIGSGVGNGDVTLNGVTITGNLIVQGGGSNSIKLNGCTITGKVVMDKDSSAGGSQVPRLALTNTTIAKIEAVQAAIIEAIGDGSPITAVEAKADVTVKGAATQVEEITVPASASAASVSLTVDGAKVETVAVEKPVTIDAKNGASPIEKVEAKDNVTLTGDAVKVKTVEVPADLGKTPVINVQTGSVTTVEANGATAVSAGTNAVVGTVTAAAPVTVSNGKVNTITVPETDSNVKVAITVGSGATVAEVAVSSAAGAAIANSGTVSSVSAANETAKNNISGVEQNQISDHIHKWNSGTETTEPNCTETGVKTFTCTVEGCTPATKEETIPALGHEWGNWTADENADTHTHICGRDENHTETAEHSWNSGVVTTDPTCTETGVKTYTCSACSATKTEDIAALGHTEVVDAAVDATCTETGLTEGKHCSVCNVVLVEQKTVPALGHKEVVDKAKEPTCTETGLTEGKHCSVCNEVLVKQETVPVKQHTWDGGKVTTKPTTTTEGVKTYTCIVCETTRTETIPVITDEETKLLISVKLGPTGDNYITYVNGEPLYEITDHFENTVTVSFADLPDVPEGTWLPSYDLRFVNCVFEKNLYVEYTDNYLELWFDRCTFKNGAKLIMKGDGSKFNDLMFDVIYDKASYIDGSHCFIRFNPAAAGRETNYFIIANRGQSIAVTGEQNATFHVGGMVDLSGLTVTSEKPIEMDAYATGTELCTINLGNNKAKVISPGTYFITADKGNVNPVTIAEGVDKDEVGLCVNNRWQQQAATSFLYNIRLEVEDGLGWLRWDLIRGKDAFDAEGNERELHYIVYAKTGIYTYEYEATEDGRLLTFPAGDYDYFEVIPYYLNGKDKVYLSGNSSGVTVKAESGEVSADKADATFTLPSTGKDYIEPEDYVVTISGLSGYQAYLMYVDSEYYNEHSKAFGVVTSGTETTAFPVSAVDSFDSTYTIYGIKDYRLVDGVLSYTIDCLRTTTNVPKAASDVPAP